MPENFHRKKHLTSFQMIILGFAGVILLGTLLLMLPVSSADGIVTPFDEALFTSTSAVCVTGLVVQDTGSYWSGFGQTVILILIQTGGLGVVTVAVAAFMLSGRKISLMQRSTMQSAISAPQVGGIVRLTKFILRGTFLVEAIGAILLLPVFCHDFGRRGIWMSVFHSVSAFCNAGFDILGTEGHRFVSLSGYGDNIWLNMVIMMDEQTHIRLLKLDKGTGQALGGAKFAVTDSKGNTVMKFVTKDDAYDITGILVVGETYTFTETSAPSGYQLAKPVKITIKDTGKVQTVTVKDAPIPDVPDTPQTGGTMPIIPLAVGLLMVAGAAVLVWRKRGLVKK